MEQYIEIVKITSAFLLSFFIVLVSVPPIIRVAKAKNLFDATDERKIHTQVVPALGGVAIFLGFILSSIFTTGETSFAFLKYIIASVILVFFIGLKDDLVNISARKKFIIQLIAAFLLILLGDLQLTSLHGILGIYGINPIASFSLTLFVLLAIMNAFNLIDGIDGLASGLALTAAVFFGAWFYLAGHLSLAIIAFALAGSLVGFFLFNVFGKKNKLFMGDTGSLIVGLVVGVLVVQFNELNLLNSAYAIEAAPAVSFAVLAVPLLDTLRVFTLRLMQGRSPFSPDRNHTHHRLLAMVPGHLNVTLILLAANASVVAAAFLFNAISFNTSIQFLLVFCIGVLVCLIPSTVLRFRSTNKKERWAKDYLSK